MNLITQIKADMKKSAADMANAKKRLAKADSDTRAAAQALQAARNEVKTIEAKQTKLAQMLKLADDDGSAPKVSKPGPKAKPAPKAASKPKAKAASKPAPKAKAKAKPAKPVNSSRAAQGRREVASGKRPPIKDVIVKVLGKRVLHANAVYEAIKAKGQLPNSGDPRGYIGYLLSASKVTITKAGKEVEVPLFERVHEKGRGFYKNRGVSAKAAPAPAKKAAAKAAPAKKSAPAPKKAAKTEKKAAGPVAKDGSRTVKCGKCGALGHNAKGHDRAVAAKEPKAAAPAKAAPAAKKADSGEKRTVKCGKCGALGHNAKGHDRAVGKDAPAAKAEAKAEPKAEVKAAEPKAESKSNGKDDSEKSTDEILAEAGIEAPAL